MERERFHSLSSRIKIPFRMILNKHPQVAETRFILIDRKSF
jgi:hypothetical protein